MLLELAIGDAYGSRFEYAPPEMVASQNNLLGYGKHPRHGTLPGYYTDDTQMSLAIAEAIVSGEPWQPERLAERFVRAFHRDPREGYATGFYHFLRGVQDGKEFLERIRPDSDKSGAAMRAAPIGIFPTIAEVTERCRVQAALTHNTPDGIHAALAAALMTHYSLYRLGPKANLGTFLEEQVPGEWATPWQGKVGSKGWMSVRAAITAFLASDSLSEMLRRSIAFTGDVDTVATIALAAGSCSAEVVSDLPAILYDGLERGSFGYDYIQDLDKQLMALRAG